MTTDIHKKKDSIDSEVMVAQLTKEKTDLQKKYEETEKQVQEFKTKYLRALADYQNLEGRVQLQREELIKNANKHLILKLLGFLDNLEKAEIFIKDPNLKMIKEQYLKILENEGLKEIEVLHKEFDPYTAEVVDIGEGEKDNIVDAVLRKGYRMNDTIIRIAQVRVSKKKT